MNVHCRPFLTDGLKTNGAHRFVTVLRSRIWVSVQRLPQWDDWSPVPTPMQFNPTWRASQCGLDVRLDSVGHLHIPTIMTTQKIRPTRGLKRSRRVPQILKHRSFKAFFTWFPSNTPLPLNFLLGSPTGNSEFFSTQIPCAQAMCVSSPFAFASLVTASYSRTAPRSKTPWSINPDHSFFSDANASGLVRISFRPAGLDTEASKNRTTFTAFSLRCLRSEVTHGIDGYFLASPFSPIAGNASGTFPETTSADSSHSYRASQKRDLRTMEPVSDIIGHCFVVGDNI